MAPRAHWRGYLKLALVSCPVALYPAIAAAERVSFRQVNRRTGNRLRQQLVDTVTGEVVAGDEKGRGYEVAHDRFVVVPDEELAAAREEARSRPYSAPPAAPTAMAAPAPAEPGSGREAASAGREPAPSRDARPEPQRRGRPAAAAPPPPEPPPPPPEPPPPPPPVVNDRTIALDRFVPVGDIDARYLDTPYYVYPRDEAGEEVFAVIRDAMRGKEMAGMGRVVLSRRERPVIVEPMGEGLLAFTLRYAHEVRNAAEHFAGIPRLVLPREMLEVAERLIELKAGTFDPAFLEDRYRTVLMERLGEKHADLPIGAGRQAPARQNVIDLMAALQRSLTAERKSGPGRAGRTAAASAKRSPAKRSTGRRC